MADRYAHSVINKMKEKLAYKFGARIMNIISDIYFGAAIAKWEAKKYKEAADNWYKSFLLNSERQESIDYYWHSINKYKSLEIKSSEH